MALTVLLTAVSLRFPSGSLCGVDYTFFYFLFFSDYLDYIQEHRYAKACTEGPAIVLGVEDGEDDGCQYQC